MKHLKVISDSFNLLLTITAPDSAEVCTKFASFFHKRNKLKQARMRCMKWIIAGTTMLTIACGGYEAAAMLQADNNDEAVTAQARKLSETDAYLDLNSGKTFHFIYDSLNDIFNRDDLFATDLYVNTRTRDTLWLDDAIVVNNGLLRDAQGQYRINPMRVKRYGNTYRTVLPMVGK